TGAKSFPNDLYPARQTLHAGARMPPMRTLIAATLLAIAPSPLMPQTITKYVRYSHAGAVSYGILDGETVRELRGDLFANPSATGKTWKLADVQLLAPVTPSKVVAVGLNYKSHLGERPAAEYPGLFLKLPTSLTATNTDIVLPSY